MLIDLLRCKKEAQDELKRKKQQQGLRNMILKWNEMGYEHFQLSAQNLYDRAVKAERNSKSLKEYMEEQRVQLGRRGRNKQDQ